jgi:PAS domain S-box-containing protein
VNGIQERSSSAHDVRRFSAADWIVAGTALFIICNGVSVCVGWWARIPILVQLFPDAPTHFNTALIFILLGVGELGLVLRRRGVVLAMAVVVICVASAELAQYALRMNLGIDTLFAVPFVGLDAPYPGRMSGNTIACFLLICSAQIFMSKPDRDAGAATTAAVILKTLAGGIAFLAMLGYLVGLKSAYGWTDSVGMSIRSCAGFLLIVIARIAALWQRDIVDKPSLPNWFLPFLAIAAGAISIGLIWIFVSPVARPYMLDPLYAEVAHRGSIAMLLSVGTLIVLGTISVLVARHKAVLARASERKLSLVMENMSDGIMLMDTKGDVFYQNPASLRIRGFQQSNMNEFTNESQKVTNESQKVTWKAWDESGQLLEPSQWPVPRIIRGEQVKGEVLRARRNDGHEFFAKCNGASIYNDGTLAFSYITIEDITKRRQAEREVRESEERFRTMANSIPQLAWIARADGFILWYNQRWYEYTGTTPEQMDGWGWQSVHDPAVLPTVLSRWREAIALVQPFEMEFPLRGADGTFRNFLTRVQPINDSTGRLVQWFGTNTDVDQLKRIEQSLRVTQARLESTLKAGSVGTWTWDIANDRLIADEFTARMFSVEAGVAAEGLPVAAYLQVVHEEDRAHVAEALGRAIQLCGAYDVEYRVRQSDGAFRWLQARGRVESDGAGQATYFHGAVIDITDRKLSELSLRESASRIAGIVNAAMDAIITIDAAHRIVLFNPAAEEMFGYSSAMLIGQPIDCLIPRRFAAAHAGHIQAFSQNNVTSRWLSAVSGLRAGGEEFPIEASISQIQIAGQQLLTVILRDVTERNRKDARLRRLVDSNVQGVMFWNAKGHVVTANDAFLSIVGYTCEDLEAGYIGWGTMTPAEYADLDRRGVEEIADKGVCTPYEKEFIRKDGSRVPVLVGAARFEDSSDEGVCFVVDITERKRVEGALREREEQLRLYAEHSPAAIAMLDRDLNYLVVSRRWMEVYQLADKVIIGRNHYEVFPEISQRWVGIHQRCLSGAVEKCEEDSFARADGTTNWLRWEVRPWRRADDSIGGIIIFSEDITARKTATEKLDQLNAALEQRVIERTGELKAANTELKAFSYTVSHDLRAPLRTVNGFAKIMLDRYGLQVPVDVEAREYLELIRQGGQQMEQLIDDLLAFSQFSRQAMNRKVVNCVELVQSVLDQSLPQREGRRIEISVADLPACQADAALLKQVWVNLISNAIKYTRGRDEAVIEIGCQHRSNEIVYFVRDNGAGFDMQHVNRLFGVFQRLHGAEEFEGTGVGLAIVQRIVNRHGGRIWAEAAVGCGATFYFTLESATKAFAPLVPATSNPALLA